MAARPWYAHYPSDYAIKTAHLSMVEHGAYRLLLDHYYSTGNPLPTDVERLLRLCRASSESERAAVQSVLREFFKEGKDGWHNPRADEELQKAAELREKCVRAGKASATKRQQESNIDVNINPTDVGTDAPTRYPTKTQPTTPTPTSHKKEEIKKLLSHGKNGNGTTTIADPHERLARFQAKIASHLGPRGWEIVASAAERTDPQHDANLAICRQAAKDLGKGWPRLWL